MSGERWIQNGMKVIESKIERKENLRAPLYPPGRM
jgi:hypothetical protein